MSDKKVIGIEVLDDETHAIFCKRYIVPSHSDSREVEAKLLFEAFKQPYLTSYSSLDFSTLEVTIANLIRAHHTKMLEKVMFIMPDSNASDLTVIDHPSEFVEDRLNVIFEWKDRDRSRMKFFHDPHDRYQFNFTEMPYKTIDNELTLLNEMSVEELKALIIQLKFDAETL